MPKFVSLFSLTSDTLARLIEHPEDRRGPVGRAAEAAGGHLEAYYWMFGQYDGLAIVEMPNAFVYGLKSARVAFDFAG